MRWEVPRRTRPTSSHWGRSRSLSARWVAERGFSPFQPETTEMSAGVAVFPSKRKPRVSTTETHTSGACGLTSKRENWHSSESHRGKRDFSASTVCVPTRGKHKVNPHRSTHSHRPAQHANTVSNASGHVAATGVPGRPSFAEQKR